MKNNTTIAANDSGKFSKGEWKLFHEAHNHKYFISDESEKLTLAIVHYSEKYAHLVGHEEAKANAERICKAVGSHDELVSALTQALEYLKEDEKPHTHFVKFATEILKRAK